MAFTPTDIQHLFYATSSYITLTLGISTIDGRQTERNHRGSFTCDIVTKFDGRTTTTELIP